MNDDREFEIYSDNKTKCASWSLLGDDAPALDFEVGTVRKVFVQAVSNAVDGSLQC